MHIGLTFLNDVRASESVNNNKDETISDLEWDFFWNLEKNFKFFWGFYCILSENILKFLNNFWKYKDTKRGKNEVGFLNPEES